MDLPLRFEFPLGFYHWQFSRGVLELFSDSRATLALFRSDRRDLPISPTMALVIVATYVLIQHLEDRFLFLR